ncbi:CREB-regulated transcription coactivator 1-like isoform X2 [Tachypleus tridentatus]|uniref:CREB-regulated transcription coactivator 1-like isoform X2 n=1 Tax=Tachypleus tridentatus TaxID=6853 RepID=UPI003FD2C082
MANPRKFSEKIALHNQKQAEETAAFEQVMREVMGATRNAQPQYLHLSPTLGSYRGGSLPNVNQIGNNSIDLQSALTSLEDMKQGKDHAVSDRIQRERGRQTSPHRSRQFPFQKHIDVSPYGSTAYLSPPPDTNWRRTNSDSALHQSAMNLQESVYGVNTSPVRRVHDMDGGIMHDTYNNHVKEHWDPRKQPQEPHQVGLSPPSPHARPKSCEVPDINIYPSQEESSLIHVPISNNTGSLPDLTNLHFPSPLATPLDIEDHSGLVYSQHSPSQSNVVTYSHVSSLSPQQHHTHGIGPNVSSGTLIQPTAGVGGAGGSRHNSPGPSPSPSSRRRHHHNSNNLMIGSSNLRHHGLHSSQQQVCYSSPRHEPPRITVEGLTIDTNALSLNNYLPQQPTFGMYPQQQSNQSPHHNYGQGQALSQSQCPQMMPVGPYHSNSVADHSSSVPNSPVSQNFSPINSPGLGPSLSLNKGPFTDNNNYTFHQHQQNHHANILHHQLEQYDVVGESFEEPDQFVMFPQRRNTTSNKNVSPPNVSTMYHTNFDSVDGSGSQVTADVGMGERNQFHYADLQGEGLPRPQDGVDTNIMYYGISSTVSEPHHHSPTLYSKSTVISSVPQSSPQTPQTPTIILTTPGGEEPLMRQDFAKDIGSAMASMTGSFDTDFFTPDDALRAGLDPIDFDGLQILTDPDISVISDPATEETFRLEHS